MSSSDSSGSSEESRAAALRLEVADKRSTEPLRASVKEAVENYFRHLDGQDVSVLFDLVMAEVEAPLLESVLAHTKGNQEPGRSHARHQPGDATQEAQTL